MLYTIGNDHWWLVRPSLKELKGAKRADIRSRSPLAVGYYVALGSLTALLGLGFFVAGGPTYLAFVAVGVAILVWAPLHYRLHYRHFGRMLVERRAINLEQGPARLLLDRAVFTGNRALPMKQWWPVLEEVRRGPVNRFLQNNQALLASLGTLESRSQQQRILDALLVGSAELFEAIDEKIGRQRQLARQERDLLAESRAEYDAAVAAREAETVDALFKNLGIG